MLEVFGKTMGSSGELDIPMNLFFGGERHGGGGEIYGALILGHSIVFLLFPCTIVPTWQPRAGSVSHSNVAVTMGVM